MTALVNRHGLQEPLVQDYERIVGSGVATSLRRERTYNTFTLGSGPGLALMQEKDRELTDGVESWSEQVLSRDSYGNPATLKERGRPQLTVTWGYNGMYPVSITEGSGTTTLTTTYTWSPGVGITGVTDPKGTTTSYSYDVFGRLDRSKLLVGPVNPITKEERYTYDGRGNLLRTEYVNDNNILPNDQYSYSGNRLVSRSRVYYDPQPVVLSTVPFTHDALGRMTHDGTSNLDITYNYLDMPEKISRNDTLLVKYLYLSDGMKTGARSSAGEGLEYRGTMTFRRSAQGALTFESVPFAAGRMTGDGIRYYVTDHLGSVRAVLDGDTGNLLEASDYSAFGTRCNPVLPSLLTNQLNNSTPSMPFRYHFTGQEEQVGITSSLSLPYTDFGARHYSPSLSRWLVPDPMSEKYYDVSPYVYCANDPVNLVDPDGDLIVFVHGLPEFGAQPGRAYWGSSFINQACRVLKDKHFNVASYDYDMFSSASQRMEDGYEYVKRHRLYWLVDVKKSEPIRFVTHSMGAAFAEGMAKCLREIGYTVDIKIHLSPFQAKDVVSQGDRKDVLTIDMQIIGDSVLWFGLFSQGDVQNADHQIRLKSGYSIKDFKYIHTETLQSKT